MRKFSCEENVSHLKIIDFSTSIKTIYRDTMILNILGYSPYRCTCSQHNVLQGFTHQIIPDKNNKLKFLKNDFIEEKKRFLKFTQILIMVEGVGLASNLDNTVHSWILL